MKKIKSYMTGYKQNHESPNIYRPVQYILVINSSLLTPFTTFHYINLCPSKPYREYVVT